MSYFLFFFLLGSNFLSHNVEGLRTEKIVGGIEADLKYHKYIVAVMINSPGGNLPFQPVCTGTIIDDWFVLTVAHCFFNKSAGIYRHEEFLIATSIKNVYDPFLSDKSLFVRVDFIVIPTYYEPPGHDDHATLGNIAVVRLAFRLGLRQGHQYLKLLQIPRTLLNRGKGLHTVAGYGWINVTVTRNEETPIEYTVSGQSDGILRFAYADIVETRECLDAVGDIIAVGNLCAKITQTDNEKKGICQGDSGSPLTQERYVFGLAINGSPVCNENEHPGIYINVPYYYYFIKNVLKNKRFDRMRIVQLKTSNGIDFKFEELK